MEYKMWTEGLFNDLGAALSLLFGGSTPPTRMRNHGKWRLNNSGGDWNPQWGVHPNRTPYDHIWMLTFRQMTILLIHFLEMSLALVKDPKMDLRWFLWAVIALDSKSRLECGPSKKKQRGWKEKTQPSLLSDDTWLFMKYASLKLRPRSVKKKQITPSFVGRMPFLP